MSQFYSAIMTNKGAALLAEAIAGNANIQFTTLVAGDGEYSEAEQAVTALQAMTSLKSQKQSVGFSSIVVESETSVHLTGALNNEELGDGYYVREVGIYAKNALDAEAEPILYSVAVAQVADYMPPYNGLTPTTIIQEYFATVDNSADVTLVAGSGAYALAGDLEKESKRLSGLEQIVKNKTDDTFSEEKSYLKGDYCVYDNALYKFTEDKEPGEWDEMAVQRTTILAELKELFDALGGLKLRKISEEDYHDLPNKEENTLYFSPKEG